MRPPSDLSKTSRALWKAIVSEYGLEDPAGLKILEVGLQALDRAQRCREQIDRDGELVADRFGQKKPHPLLPAERDSRAQFMAAMKALNLDLEPLQDGPGRPAGR